MDKVIIDVRDPGEYATGHVQQAINVPLSSFNQVHPAINSLPKDAQIVVYCRSGARSAQAQSILKSWGYGNVTNGINQRNVEAGLA